MAKRAKKAAKKAARKGAPKGPRKAAKKAKKAAKKAGKKSAKKAGRKSAKKSAKKAGKSGKKKSARKPNAAFMVPLTPSAQLAEVVGAKAMPRTDIIKKIWDYIKKKGLQDSKNRRMINADDKLKPVFGGKGQVSMFDLAKIVNKHAQ